MNEEELSDLPWTIEADMVAAKRKVSLGEATDLVIIKALSEQLKQTQVNVGTIDVHTT